MERNLASIQKVIGVAPIEGADAIERVDILGWQCVAKKGEFKAGDIICYLEIDSLLPRAPWNEFLFKPGRDDKDMQYRLKTVKLRGQISQGLVLPLSILEGKKYPSDNRENTKYDFHEGMDVTGLLGVVKYEPPIPAQLAGICKGQFPCFIPKTDETRVESEPKVLDEIRGKMCHITEKADGSSGTFFWNHGAFGVCSRNLEFCEDATNSFWEMAKKYDLANKMATLGKNIAIQGELVGEGVQSNRLKLKGHDLRVFNVYDIDAGKYLNVDQSFNMYGQLGLNPVTTVYSGIFKPEWTVETLVEMAKGKYPGTDNDREGIVIRSMEEQRSEALKGRLSFKCINRDYLLNGGE